MLKIKVDINDTLFSKIVQFGKTRCDKCGCVRKLQCAHIFSRRYKGTRHIRRNAVALCSDCHKWFDTHKIMAVIFCEEKRVFTSFEEGFSWLVKKMGYTWDELVRIYHKAQTPFPYSSYKKSITEDLKKQLKELENGR